MNPALAVLHQRDAGEPVAFRAGRVVTIGELLGEANDLAERLPGAEFAINLSTNRYQYLLGFCAAALAGHCTLMPPNRQEDTLAELEKSYPGCYRLENRSLEPGSGVKVRSTPGKTADRKRFSGSDRPAVIAFTSGSTGVPAPIAKSWSNLLAGTRSNRGALLDGLSPPVNLLATVPAQHMWGLETSILLPLLARVAVSEVHPLYPQDIAEALARLPAPRVLVSSPLHLRALAKSGVELVDIERVLTATAPLTREAAIELEQQLDTLVLDVFGCSESGIIATRRTAEEQLWKLAEPFSLESSATGTSILAPHLPEAVRLPDLVQLEGDRHFRWLGRQQDMVNVAGKRGSLADLNRRLLAVPGVEDGVIFQPDGAERLAAMVVAPGLQSADIRHELRPQFEPVFMPRPLLLVSALPRQETGKLARLALLAAFEEARHDQKPGTVVQDPSD